MIKVNANVDGLFKLRAAARNFAKNYVSNFKESGTTPEWRKYLLDLCSKIDANSEHHLEWTEESSGRSRLEFHYELLNFLSTRPDLAFEENERIRILAAYGTYKNATLLQIMRQHLSNQGNQFVAFLADLVVKEFPEVLQETCFEVGGVEAHPFYDFLSERLGPGQMPKDYVFSQKGAVGNTSGPLKKIQYDYHLPLELMNIGAIFIPRTFHWAKDKDETLRHLRKSLKANGRIFIADLNKHSSREEINPMEVSATFIPGFVEGNGFLDRDDCIKLLQAHEFTIERDFAFGQGPVNVSYVLVARATQEK